MSRKIKVLWISDDPRLSTGFGRVTRELLKRLSSTPIFQFECVGWGGVIKTHCENDLPVVIHPCSFETRGSEILAKIIRSFRPELIIAFGELRNIEWLADIVIVEKLKWIGYIPIDGGPFYAPWIRALETMSLIITTSEFGRGVIKAASWNLPIEVLYHGVDCHLFKPLQHRFEIKAHPRFAGKFVIGCVARNQQRKNIPALVNAFAQMSGKHGNLHLVLHCTHSEDGYDLPDLLRTFKLHGRADLSVGELTIANSLTDSKLCELYNLFDLFVLPTMAEGFGLPILEAMSCGVPVVVTDCSSCRELVSGRGELARVKTTITSGWQNLEYAIVDVDHLADCIERLLADPNVRSKYAAAGREFAVTLDWDLIADKLQEMILRVFRR